VGGNIAYESLCGGRGHVHYGRQIEHGGGEFGHRSAGSLGITMAYSISSRAIARAIWNRVTTRDDDSDIVLSV